MEGNARSPGQGPQAQPLLPQTQQEHRQAQSPPPQPEYSTLEVAPDTHHDSAPQVYYESAPEPVSAGAAGFYAPNKAPYGLSSDQSPTVVGQASPHPHAKSAHDGLHPIPAEHEIGTPGEKPKKTVTMSRKKMWIIGAVVFLLIIAAAVGGGVGGTLAARNNSSSNSTSGSGGGGSSSPNEGGGGSSAQPGTGGLGLALNSSGLAAVNYTVGTTDYRMVFWQPRNDSSNLVYSLWDSSQTDGWKVISINSKLTESKAVEALPGTPIAATARPRLGRNQRHAVSVFFLSDSNVVQELRTSDPRGASWTKVTHPVTAAKSSQLAAQWDVCETSACSDLVALNYEAEDHRSTWLWPGLTDSSSQAVKNATSKTTVPIIPGSGIAVATAMDPDLNNTAQQNMKLYFQDPTSQNLKEVSREYTSRYVISQTKLATNMSLDKPVQLDATSFYKDSAARYLFLLMRAADGTVQAMHWNTNTWRQPTEPVFRNAPADVGKSFAAVAVTNELKVYALARDGNSFYTFNADKNDPITWTYDSAVKLE
ncbi:hypothetical protein RB595_009437 [Gaeumannomyces hyphopodioides]